MKCLNILYIETTQNAKANIVFLDKDLNQPGLMGDIGAKVAADNAVPSGVVPGGDHDQLVILSRIGLTYFLSNSFLM